MGIKDYGKLARLKIMAKSGAGDPFVVMFNPESYSQTFSTVYRDVKTIDTGLENNVYVKSMPQDFKLKIIIDGTGVSDYNSAFFPTGLIEQKRTVLQRVKDFLNLAWYPKNNQAVTLTIVWGSFSFDCVLKEVTINYTLFDREGNPLRAELDACFISDPEKLKADYEKQKRDRTQTGNTETDTTDSGDLSEKITVKSGIVISAS
jgi:hypothetical protein